MLSKSLSTSEKFAALVTQAPELFEFCHALYPLLMAHTDDFGRLQGDAFTVKHQCYPASPRSLEDFAAALLVMHDVELIIWYSVAGKKFIQIQKFEAHQSGLHKRTRSSFPRVPDVSGNSLELPGQLKGTKENLTKEKRSTDKAAVQVLIDYYSDGYLQRFGERPHISGGKDGAILKGLLGTTKQNSDEVKRRIDAMLDSTDPFIVQSCRTIGVLQACWNKLGGPMTRLTLAKPIGCRHDPPCADDAACTKRRIRDAKVPA